MFLVQKLFCSVYIGGVCVYMCVFVPGLGRDKFSRWEKSRETINVKKWADKRQNETTSNWWLMLVVNLNAPGGPKH